MSLHLPRRTALVLGGGGLKGFAHIGVLRALLERGVRPSIVAGTSIGSLIGAAYVGGVGTGEMADRARGLRRRDLFRLNHVGMLFERIRCPALYLGEPLRELVESVCPNGTFRDLSTPLLVNTVDLARGSQVVWGLPGLQDVSVVDAVYASCALPGFFPPGELGGRVCIDGGTSDNLPAGVAALDADAVIAVDVGSSERDDSAEELLASGFASIYMRAASTMMRALQQGKLAAWSGPPMLLIRPPVWHMGMFNFGRAGDVIEAGYQATCAALDGLGDALFSPGGVHPRRLVDLAVNRDDCIGCRMCVGLSPHLMAMGDDGKAHPRSSPVEWSRPDGEIIYHCPTRAITVRPVERIQRPTPPGELRTAAD